MKFLTTLTILLCSISVNSQSLSELFAIDGLQINAYHYNWTVASTWSTSYTFDKLTTIDDKEVHVFKHNRLGIELTLFIEDERVFEYDSQNEQMTLIYDFGLQIGETMTESQYKGYTLVETGDITLLNGEIRTFDRLKLGDEERVIIEGIGDIESGLIPNFLDFEGYDVFICSKINGDLLIEGDHNETYKCDEYSCIYPVSDFSYSIEDFELNLENEAANYTSFYWDFGDGNTSTDINPSHNYSTPGCYEVSLICSNDCIQEIINSAVTKICVDNAWDQETFDGVTATGRLFPINDSITITYANEEFLKINRKTNTSQALNIAPDGVTRRLNTIKFWDESHGLAGGDYSTTTEDKRSVLITNDGGLTWHSAIPESYHISNILIQENGKASVWRNRYYNHFYRTIDYGQTWDTIFYNYNKILGEFLYSEGNTMIARGITTVPGSANKISLAVSTDDGHNWTNKSLPFHIQQIQFFTPQDGMCTDGYWLYETSDGGDNWTKITDVQDVDEFYFYNKSTGWYITGDGVVFYTDDNFATSQVTDCGANNLHAIFPTSETTAYALGEEYHPPATWKAINQYDFITSNISNCSIVDQDADGFYAHEDCDDNNAMINPDQEEVPYNGYDDDCNAATLDDDLDQDGYLLIDDCDDNDPSINPGAEEIADNGIDENCDNMDLTTSTKDIEQLRIDVFPNPASSELNINIEGDIEYELRIHNLLGKLIYVDNNNQSLSLNDIPNGTYVIVIRDLNSNQMIVKKLVVAK